MIALIAYWLIGKGVGVRAARPIAWAIVIGVALILAGVGKCTYDANVITTHEAKTSAKLERTGRQADTSAAQRAAARRRAEATARKEFDNATAGIPDNGLTDRQRIDLCNELRDGGVDTSLIPECSDVRAGAQAAP
ncbi:hypothetical protein [Sphingopyxis sp. FD7]|uniref:hypothetical protein n=1 Tax=Sphingopyxis sp. FD7 TaxID=1914525 RepID=UPI000DC6397B|nr:hypothetical protein [Sphingopyxis sp. FD7]BBB13413.1 hypothetical protein SPYCA_2671 [Sphingopyxis sp. FD7]